MTPSLSSLAPGFPNLDEVGCQYHENHQQQQQLSDADWVKQVRNDPWRFAGRRSVVHSAGGMIACTQPLAAQCGLDVLRKGGNAADAAVAVAAALALTEPTQTGIGGDMFMLYRDAATGSVSALNGSGRSPRAADLEVVRSRLGIAPEDEAKTARIPWTSALSITVPGQVAGWVDTVERFGSHRVELADVLGPAIRAAEEGFPVSEIVAHQWQASEHDLRASSANFAELLKPDPYDPGSPYSTCNPHNPHSPASVHGVRVRAPRAGEIFRNPNLARVYRAIASGGKKGFYAGWVADAMVQASASHGGLLTHEDLLHHIATTPSDAPSDAPISITVTGFGLGEHEHLQLWEHPPNGQGVVALMAVGILQAMERSGQIPTFGERDHLTVPYLHAVIEALRIAFSDGNWFVADLDEGRVPVRHLISDAYLAQRAKLFDPAKAQATFNHGNPIATAIHRHCSSHADCHDGQEGDKGQEGQEGQESQERQEHQEHQEHQEEPSPALRSSDTVYFCVVDKDGNAASFITSNYTGFGTHIVPEGCGFPLQSRGNGFSLQRGHPNVIAPRKRAYHTIIPGMVTYLPKNKDKDNNINSDTTTNQDNGKGSGNNSNNNNNNSAPAGELHSTFGVMGGYMQPQGHVQVLLSQIIGKLDVQQALDAPRICVSFQGAWTVDVEEGIPPHVVRGLQRLGHAVRVVRGHARSVFGRGQLVRRTVDPVEKRAVYSAGSDMRGDGAAYPVV